MLRRFQHFAHLSAVFRYTLQRYAHGTIPIVLQLLSYVAQTEREFIRQPQTEGIAAAKTRGVQFGRQPSPKPAEFPE